MLTIGSAVSYVAGMVMVGGGLGILTALFFALGFAMTALNMEDEYE